MSIHLMWEVQKIQHSLGSLVPTPLSISTNILSTIHMIWTVAHRFFSSNKIDTSYALGTIVNFVVGDHIALAAQVVLVVRKFLQILEVKTALGKSYKEMRISLSGEFPIPEVSLWTAAAKRTNYIFCSMNTLLAKVAEYAWSLVDLTFSFTANSITKEDAKNGMIANIIESYTELKNDPTKISREIEEHREFVDWLLTKLDAPIRAKNISALLTSVIETGIHAGTALTNTYKQTDMAFQTGARVVCAIVAPSSPPLINTNPINTNQRTVELYGNKTLSHTSCKSKIRPYSERFFSTY